MNRKSIFLLMSLLSKKSLCIIQKIATPPLTSLPPALFNKLQFQVLYLVFEDAEVGIYKT